MQWHVNKTRLPVSKRHLIESSVRGVGSKSMIELLHVQRVVRKSTLNFRLISHLFDTTQRQKSLKARTGYEGKSL